MTAEQAVEELDDSLAVWSRYSMEAHPASREPEEMVALGRARDALDVLRTLHIKPVKREAA